MRLRNIPRAESVLKGCREVIDAPALYRGSWNDVFGNENPLYIEIGMGKGKFLLTMAERHPERNYIGIERYSSVLLRAVEKYMESENEAPRNIRFICMDAADIADVFDQGEVSGIYLNFSDPWPKARHARRRLTSKEYLYRYDKIAADGAMLEFKTDNRGLFDFSIGEVRECSRWEMGGYTTDLHSDEDMNRGNVMTEYEEKFSAKGNPICKLRAVRKA
ncbi:tRNA (guanine-N(7)-)-methyltransferase [Lachnospiraceae bacterium]|uniref:tRNA (guanosine(46)-N7)-methyltransferase TrmB n=1 Tax=Extibacter sp. GGCC_0201 TaxID=2731209 RepID=UPI001AA0F8AF|nr:tRNA (guanosine(46)-N7)-methyltransferase TrmB [Extibacter sp. GGCC_0201]MBO1719852.1 tRNA (guanosine(46)-N7)-methyltransferase TrmB [Extibacter sp. GGCC_0201]BDF35750.1 tRNA (guanine-N(7)-)-methyltransferase [Lachnospiraceae bacterium]BDF39752.1 tRNA (guanine-N(7)-)-methyltransferase [Lachnospiraceae bacterium]